MAPRWNKYDSNLQNRTLLFDNNPVTILNPGGGLIGVCAAGVAVVAGTGTDLWITEFYSQDTLRKLGDYGSATTGSGANTYKNLAGRLYENPSGTHTNTTPDVIRNRGLKQAPIVQPLLVTTPEADPVTVDLYRGMIGLVNIGISNSGDFFAALLAKANKTSRNAAVTLVNAAEHARLTSDLADASNVGWNNIAAKCMAAGLVVGAETGTPSGTALGSPTIRRFPRPVTRALLQLSASLEYATQACYVHRVNSGWDESGTNAIKESNAPAEQECVGTLPNSSRSHAIALDVTTVVNQYRGQRLSFRFRAMNTGDSGSDPTNRRAWYSRDDDSSNPTPNRGPKLILVETSVTEPFAYLERSVDSALAQRLH